MKFNFTDTELTKILKNLVILVDTREKDCKSTIAYFEKNKIKYEMAALKFGDYSAKLEAGSIKGIDRDIYFTNDIVIENKKDIDELCGNLKDKASRIKNEFAHINKYNTKVFIFVRDGLYFKHLYNQEYRSKYLSKSLRARLKSICAEYKTQIIPISKEFVAQEIFETLYYEVRNILKNDCEVKGNE